MCDSTNLGANKPFGGFEFPWDRGGGGALTSYGSFTRPVNLTDGTRAVADHGYNNTE